MLSRVHETRLQTRWTDFDALGHITHAAYPVYLDEARDAVLTATVGPFSEFAWVRTRRQQFAWLPDGLLARYARSYGTRLATLLAHCRARADLGEEIVAGLYEVEADYLVRQEWAMAADDILWRRTKLGLHVAPGAAQRLDAWLTARRRGTVAAQ